MHKRIEDALAICLEKIENGSATMESCIMEFPQFKEELLEILPLITPLKTLNQIKPTEKFSKNAGERLLARLPDLPVTFWSNFRLIFKNKIFKPTRRLTMPQTLISVIVALSILFGGSYAIEASGPGDVFYQADRVIEVFRERLTLSLEKEISLRFRFATERLEEAQKKISEGNIEDSMSGLAAYNKAIMEIIKIVDENQNSLNQEEIQEMSQESLSKQAGILDRIRLSWPEHDTKHQHAYQKSYQIANMGAEALLGPNEDAPLGPPEDAPQGPNEDAPQGPNEDAPQAPNEDAPQAPNEDAPQAPNEDAPQAPNEDAPKAPNEDAPQAPNEDAPQAPNEDAPQAPNEDAPQEPNADAPQEPNDDAPQGPTSGKP